MQDQRIPAYGFYGEAVDSGLPDLLFVERLRDRSARHGWTIEAHRHPNLVQLFLLSEGAVDLHLDGRQERPTLPAALFVPTGAVHAFRFAEESEGLVVTWPAWLVDRVLAASPDLTARLRQPAVLSLPPGRFLPLWDRGLELEARYPRRDPGRSVALQALTALLLCDVARLMPTQPSAAPVAEPTRQLADRLEATIEARFRDHPSVDAMAAALGVGRSRLTRAARNALGRSPLGLLHDRLILEARRDLAYSVKPVAAVAHGLGFQDPAYFVRFFKRHTGRTPLAERRAALGSRPGPGVGAVRPD